MLADILQWGLGMFLIFGGIMALWFLADRRSEKTYQMSERIRELEQWKAGEELRQSREFRRAKETHIWKNELDADLSRGDSFDLALREMLDGVE